ncbi:cystathionine beta-lyase [Candidatus Raskinella chloraquaticus]|jgi:cysteine-S-conjugate beta-lyase|uniref:Cystathionine beta-lyase n=1 Tax=Candidatus Raskinella chloraquaticus TaxID=1951219 RepID=A0A1W9HXG5_9HYPH|nr:MAG: cystathionine beta-lyase [Proteobacteria bacterium SG_bin8]
MTKTSAPLDKFQPETQVVLAGRDPFRFEGFVNTPIWRGSTVLKPTIEAYNNRATARYTYGTYGTPTTDALETAWSAISKAAGTVLVPSGLAAVAVALQSCLKAGDHLLVTDSVYRPTRNFCESFLKRFGVETTYYDPLIGAGITSLMRANTTAVFTEAPGSQSFEMQDIPAIAKAAHDHGAVCLMDNTWATPLLFPPHERGVDLAIEAGTKYLSGHSDLLLGLVSANERCWPALRQTFDSMSICAGPEDVFLGLRGLRTMVLRVKEAGWRGLEMARWFEARPEVKAVLHPALPSHPGHALWKRDFLGATGLFSIILHPVSPAALAAMVDGLDLFGIGASWGGYESLVLPFDCTPYRTATPWEPGGPTLRFQIGLEDIGDLQRDLAAGFDRLKAAS